MTQFIRFDDVTTPDGTRAKFIKYTEDGKAIIAVGMDSRVVDPVSLRRADL